MTPTLAVGAVVLEPSASGPPKVVLVRRSRPPLAGRWSLPGGKVEGGERLVDAVAREVREETGVEISVGPLLEVVEVITDGFHYVILDYLGRRIGGSPRAGDDAAEIAFVPVDRLADYEVSPAVVRVVDQGTSLLANEPGEGILEV